MNLTGTDLKQTTYDALFLSSKFAWALATLWKYSSVYDFINVSNSTWLVRKTFVSIVHRNNDNENAIMNKYDSHVNDF